MEGLIVPSKLYGVLAAGRASVFIGDPDGEVAAVLTSSGSGLVVAQGDGTGLARLIEELGRDPVRIAEMGARAPCLRETV